MELSWVVPAPQALAHSSQFDTTAYMQPGRPKGDPATRDPKTAQRQSDLVTDDRRLGVRDHEADRALCQTGARGPLVRLSPRFANRDCGYGPVIRQSYSPHVMHGRAHQLDLAAKRQSSDLGNRTRWSLARREVLLVQFVHRMHLRHIEDRDINKR